MLRETLLGTLALVSLVGCVLDDTSTEEELGSTRSALVWQSSGGFESGLGLPGTFVEGQASTPWITTGVHYNGSHALGTRTLGDTDGTKERSEVFIADKGDYGHLRFTRIRHIGMAIYPHEDSDDNTNPVVILQAVQYGGVAASGNPPTHVPFVIWMQYVNGTPKIRVEVTDSDNVAHDLSEGWITIPSMEWTELMVNLEPRHKNNPGPLGGGLVQVRLDGDYIANERMDWGFVPDNDPNNPAYGGSDGNPNDNWRISTGVYAPNPSVKYGVVILFLDDVKLGSSWSEVDP